MNLKGRIQHAWNAFTAKESGAYSTNGSSSYNPAHRSVRRFNNASYVSAIFNRIALDVATTTIQHVKINPKNDDREHISSGLINCLTTEANIDQTGMAFLQDVVYSMFDEGVVAIVPVDTTSSPTISGAYEINTMRVGKITQWYPSHVEVSMYNEQNGLEERVMLPKSMIAIIENPLYAVINGPNATLTRLINKMAMLDDSDELLSSGKLDIVIKLPFAVKTDLQKTQAEDRIKGIEDQLAKGKHGIVYTDAAENLQQLNRPVNNKMIEDIQYLSQQFHNQLGLTEKVFNGTASESELRVYYTRSVDTILKAILSECNRKFLTKTARTQGQTLEAYRDPFTLVPIEQVGTIADTFRRNSILTSNEIRRIVGFKPSNDPEADRLYNPNIAESNMNQPGGKPPLPKEKPGSLTPPDKEPTKSK